VYYALSARASQQISAFYETVLRRRIDERGASLVEYVLLLSLIALACMAAVKFFGTQTAVPYRGAASGLQG
jgi:Flp pilus assembly pilin Flp